jgi:hypothetical protein
MTTTVDKKKVQYDKEDADLIKNQRLSFCVVAGGKEYLRTVNKHGIWQDYVARQIAAKMGKNIRNKKVRFEDGDSSNLKRSNLIVGKIK